MLQLLQPLLVLAAAATLALPAATPLPLCATALQLLAQAATLVVTPLPAARTTLALAAPLLILAPGMPHRQASTTLLGACTPLVPCTRRLCLAVARRRLPVRWGRLPPRLLAAPVGRQVLL